MRLAVIEELEKAAYAGDFFCQDEFKIRQKYRETAKLIHPDICSEPGAKEAFEKLNLLYEAALKDIQNGSWAESNVLHLSGFSPIRYRNKIKTEIGERYVTDDQVIWTFDDDKLKYCQLFLDSINLFDWKRLAINLSKVFSKRVPVINRVMDQSILLMKNPNDYPLDLFLQAYGEQLDGRDIAWMISRTCDLACFLKMMDIVHNGLEPKNLFINPTDHSISILGGWQYAVKRGHKMTGVSHEIFDLMTTQARTSKIATSETDIESIRRMFQRIVCDKDDIPAPMMDWIMKGSSDDALHEFVLWDEALKKAYGVRKFKRFSAEADKIYTQN